jgi:hypothetical protein
MDIRIRACLTGFSWMLLGCAGPGAGADELDSSESETSSGSSESESAVSTSESETESSSESEMDTGEPEPEPERVLFVGNSYTFANDLPGLFAAITEAGGAPWIVDSIAIAGASVAYHVVNPNTATKLAEGWDVVVLQGQSVEPVVDQAAFVQSVVDFAALVEVDNPDSELILYETWAREVGNSVLTDLGMTAEQMQAALTAGYAAAADASGARVAPVGQAWALALEQAPEIDLFTSDGSHPSLAGSFLAVCVFLGTITGAEAASSDYVPGSLPPADADTLEPIADMLTLP